MPPEEHDDTDIDEIAAKADNPDAVKAALVAERTAAREARAELEKIKGEKGPATDPDSAKAVKAAEKRAKEAEAALDKIKRETATEHEKAILAAKDEGRIEALTPAHERIVRAEVKAAAAGKFANPALAPKVIDLDEFEVDDDGNVDEKKIGSAIDAFLKDNPELAAKGRKPTGDGGGGPRGSGDTFSMDDWLRQQAKR